MKTNDNTLFCVTLILMLGMGALLVGHAAQAQEHERFPISAEQKASEDQAAQLVRAAAADLHSENYAEAEEEARQAQSFNLLAGAPEEIIAKALDRQHKDQEALQIYRTMVVDGKATYPRILYPYALLLLKSGQWGKALAAYNQVVTQFPDNTSLAPVKTNFSVDTPEPAALETALHIEYGRMLSVGEDWAGERQNREAFAEFGKALQLAPDSDVVNYYYGYGWQKLSPSEQKHFGSEQQAKAALQKAVRLGKGPVKVAAQKALRVAMKAK